MSVATILHPVRGLRHFFRDGPRSLRRFRVTRVAPTSEDRVISALAGLAMFALGVVAFLVAPSRWIAWPLGLALLGTAPFVTNRIVVSRIRRRVGSVEWAAGFFLTLTTYLMLWSITAALVVVLLLFRWESWEWNAVYIPAEVLYFAGLWRFNRQVRAARESAGTGASYAAPATASAPAESRQT